MHYAVTCLSYFNAFRFVATVLAATWVFVRGTAPRRGRFALRFGGVLAAAAALALANPVAFALTTADGWNGPSMFAFMNVWTTATFLLALLGVKRCYAISWTNAMARWILGLCTERFITAFVHNWLFFVIVPDFSAEHPYSYMAICVVVYALFITLAAALLAPQFARNAAPDTTESRTLCTLYAISAVLLVVITSWSMNVTEYDVPHLADDVGADDPNLVNVLCFGVAMAGIFAVVILLFQFAIFHVAVLHKETALLNLLAEQKGRQYQTLKENVDFINRKAHDLKHQIAALEFGDDERRRALVRETRDAIAVYDSAVSTGNEALDTLLTERSFYCAHHGIRLSCMVGGCDFSSIDVVDLFTMVGNALDNAFEHVLRFEDPDRRVVSFTATQRGDLIVMTVANHFEGAVTLHDGLPLTTKADAFSHGLGLKSIRNIARRYGGDIHISAREPMFTLRISLMAPGGGAGRDA